LVRFVYNAKARIKKNIAIQKRTTIRGKEMRSRVIVCEIGVCENAECLYREMTRSLGGSVLEPRKVRKGKQKMDTKKK